MHIYKKNKFDSLRELEKSSWEEFQEKTKLEGRFSYAIWGAILTAIAASFAGKASIRNFPEWTIYLTCFLPIFFHFIYLYWIQTCLRRSRSIIYDIRKEMWELIDFETNVNLINKEWYKHLTLWVQLGITFF